MIKKTTQKVPELRFPDFNSAWKIVPLESLLSFKNGINASKDQYGTGYKFINVLDIINNITIDYESIIGSVNVPQKEFANNIVEYGDILFQRSSETREDVGQSNVYVDKIKKATFGGFVIRGKKIGDYEPIFLNYLLKTAKARKEITSKSGGSTRYNIGQETLKIVEIISPSLPEQQKIANFLTAVDKNIKLLTQKKTLLEQYKKGVMQKIFNQEIRFQPDSQENQLAQAAEPTAIYGKNQYPDWEVKKLGEVGNIISGLTYSPKDINEDGVLVLRSSNVKNRVIKLEDNVYVSSNNFNPVVENDILICVRNGSKNLIGKNALITKEIAGVAFGAFMSIYRSDYNKFLFHYFDSNSYKKEVNKNLGATINSINGSDLKKFKVPFPCLKEQQKIATFLSALDDKIEHAQSQIDHYITWKKGLLQRMFV